MTNKNESQAELADYEAFFRLHPEAMVPLGLLVYKRKYNEEKTKIDALIIESSKELLISQKETKEALGTLQVYEKATKKAGLSVDLNDSAKNPEPKKVK